MGLLIHNNTRINFWLDNWTGFGPLQDAIHGLLHHHDETILSRDTWDTNGNWALDSLSFAFPQSILNIIKVTPKSFHSDLDDLPTWDCSPNGKFSTHSAYMLST